MANRMKLILMTVPYFFIEEHQILTALFDEGLEVLHLRKPGTSIPSDCSRSYPNVTGNASWYMTTST